jgi:hypothetical protein
MSLSKCDAWVGGYDGLWGIYCDLPQDHPGWHRDNNVEWRETDDDERTQKIREEVRDRLTRAFRDFEANGVSTLGLDFGLGDRHGVIRSSVDDIAHMLIGVTS